jgi:hypothetical protein
MGCSRRRGSRRSRPAPWRWRRANRPGRWRGRSFPQRQGIATPGEAGAGGWAGTGANWPAPARWRCDRAPAGNRAAETGTPEPAGLRAAAGCSPATPGSADQSESAGAAGRCLLRFLAKHGEAALAGVGRQPQAPAQLLQKHESAWSGALGGPQEQHRVDRWDVEPFVEQVDGEEDLQLAGLQTAQGGLANGLAPRSRRSPGSACGRDRPRCCGAR